MLVVYMMFQHCTLRKSQVSRAAFNSSAVYGGRIEALALSLGLFFAWVASALSLTTSSLLFFPSFENQQLFFLHQLFTDAFHLFLPLHFAHSTFLAVGAFFFFGEHQRIPHHDLQACVLHLRLHDAQSIFGFFFFTFFTFFF